MRFSSRVGSSFEVETVDVPGGFSTVVRDHRGHIVEPARGRGYVDDTIEQARGRHDLLVEQRQTQLDRAAAAAEDVDRGDD